MAAWDDPAATEPLPLDHRRRRTLLRIVLVGVGVAVALGLLAGVAGASGAAGAAIVLLLSSATCAVAAAWGVVAAVIDDLRDEHVSRGRIVWVVVLFVVAAALMAMTAGIGG